MLKFFRKIRQKLLEENKIGSYLKYAIGEIILVVIGILIALQINNWNEDRKAKIKADEIYLNLITSLEQDSIEVSRAIYSITKSLATQRQLILNTKDEFPSDINDKNLDRLVGEIAGAVMSFFPKTGVYNLLTSNNSIDLLRSEKIKSLLINLYDFQYKRYENIDTIIDQKYHYQLGMVIRKKIGFIIEYNHKSEVNVIKSVDPKLFNEHYKELVEECRDIYGLTSTGKNYLIEIEKSIYELLQLIKEELRK